MIMELRMLRYLTLITCLYLPGVRSALDIDGLSKECYAEPGNILLGYIASARTWSRRSEDGCGRVSAYGLQSVQAFKYGIQKARDDPHILPNITVGFVILDTCSSLRSFKGQSLFFIPDEESPPPLYVHSCPADAPGKQHYRVAGILGSGSSDMNTFIVPPLGVVDVAVVSTIATSDTLLDKATYPNFYSLSPPDRYQTQMMLELMVHFNWTYFSLVYIEGSYGENAAKEFHRTVEQYSICIAESFIVYYSDYRQEIPSLLNKLTKIENMRAVVLFMGGGVGSYFFEQVEQLDLVGRFVWIGSDAFSLRDYHPAATGSFFVHFPETNDTSFNDVFHAQMPSNNPGNPWMREYWQSFYNCSWAPSSLTETFQEQSENSSCSDSTECTVSQSVSDSLPSCFLYENSTEPIANTSIKWMNYKSVDATYMLALGIHVLLKEKCPGVFENISLLESCFTGFEYIESLSKVQFMGSAGHIKFDSDGIVEPTYLIRQYLYQEEDTAEIIAVWSAEKGLSVYSERISWSIYDNYTDVMGDSDGHIPMSVCSRPCLPRQYLIQKEQECCWDCRYCRENEIVKNGTSCHICVENTWPDTTDGVVCEPIPAVYLRGSDNLGLALTCISTLGLALTLATLVLIIKYRKVKLIKASSRELSILILTGILLAFVSTFFYVIPPHSVTCFLRDFGFSVSVTSLYAPMLVKANRVYRIFNAGRKGEQHPLFISSRAQVFFCVVLLSIQVVLSILVSVVLPSKEVQRMPVLIEKYSESLCDTPLEALFIRISYNLVLLVACAIYGFLTRKLPENFNESQFIFISVTTTVFIWLVFLPTYLTSFYAYHQASLMSLCLILNGFITLVCLFVPKLYAVYFVDEKDLKFSTTTTTIGTASTIAR